MFVGLCLCSSWCLLVLWESHVWVCLRSLFHVLWWQEVYQFKHPNPKRPKSLRIYEAHVGMSSTVCQSVISSLYINFWCLFLFSVVSWLFPSFWLQRHKDYYSWKSFLAAGLHCLFSECHESFCLLLVLEAPTSSLCHGCLSGTKSELIHWVSGWCPPTHQEAWL
jgi:hypothetical protein